MGEMNPILQSACWLQQLKAVSVVEVAPLRIFIKRPYSLIAKLFSQPDEKSFVSADVAETIRVFCCVL
jgi:hypothetical protein